MQNVVLSGLSNEKILQSKLSTIVTEDCVVVPSFSGQPHTALSLLSINALKVVKTYHPGLLVISAGLFLLAAAANSSKEGSGTAVPIGLLGAVFLLAFFASQRARVVFISGSEATQSFNGSFTEVADVVLAVRVARRNLLNLSSETIKEPGFFARIRQSISGIFSSRVRTIAL